MEIESQKRAIAEILSFEQHVIPRYQRAYAWDEQDISDFVSDITKTTEPHFLGSMVVSGPPQGSREVIDGQQRLTTILIALAVLRNRYQQIGDEGRVAGITGYLEHTDRNGKVEYRLLNRDSNAYNRLRDAALTNPSRKIKKKGNQEGSPEGRAFNQFLEFILNEEERYSNPVEALDDFRDKLLQLEVVYIRVTARDDAFTIFETLNDRGKNLTTMDLVKNLLFSHVKETADDTIERSWSKIMETVSYSPFEGLNPDLFLYYHWNSLAVAGQATAEVVEQNRLRRAIDELIESEPHHRGERALRIVKDLDDSADYMEAFGQLLNAYGSPEAFRHIDPKYRTDKWQTIGARLYGILVTGASQPLPLLLALTRAFFRDKNRISQKLYTAFLTNIESFQFRWSIAQKGSTSSIRRLYRHSASLVDAAASRRDFAGALAVFTRTARPLYPSDTQFKDGLSSLSYSKSQKKEVFKVRHILSRIEYANRDSRLSGQGQMSIEHLEPLSGRSEESRRNFWIFKLGNLTLLPHSVNAELPNEFSEKAKQLDKHVRATDSVLRDAIRDKEWNNARFNDRHKAMLEAAVQLWPLPDAPEDPSTD